MAGVGGFEKRGGLAFLHSDGAWGAYRSFFVYCGTALTGVGRSPTAAVRQSQAESHCCNAQWAMPAWAHLAPPRS
jgi:hypothetical protein